MKLKFKLLSYYAKLPCYKHDGDSGMDVCALESCVIPAGGYAKVRTGVAAEIPEGYELQLRPRSGMSSDGVLAAFGTIDSGYRGEICAVIYNLKVFDFVCISEGDRIAQLVLAPVTHAEIEQVEELDTSTERGTDGFGSTGV